MLLMGTHVAAGRKLGDLGVIRRPGSRWLPETWCPGRRKRLGQEAGLSVQGEGSLVLGCSQ